VEEISIVGRNTQGVRLINLAEGESLIGIQRIDEIDESDETGEEIGEVLALETDSGSDDLN
jgi:DNA gyrase subunit A